MNDVVSSFLTHLNTKMKTQVYGIFAFWWIVWHWETIFTVLFVNEDKIFEKTSLLKNEYLRINYFQYDSANYWFWQGIAILFAAAMTYLMIWIVPKLILERAFREEKEHDFRKRGIVLTLEEKLEKKNTSLVKEKKTRLEAAEKTIVREKEIEKENPEVIWQQEYEQFKTSPLYEDFHMLIESIYEHNGNISIYDDYSNRYTFRIPQPMLVYADVNSLVDLNNQSETIRFTDKGRYFVKQFSTEAHR